MCSRSQLDVTGWTHVHKVTHLLHMDGFILEAINESTAFARPPDVRVIRGGVLLPYVWVPCEQHVALPGRHVVL